MRLSLHNQKSKLKNLKSHRFSGDFVGRVTPVPIPNTEVKPAGADGTARETAWESRKSPGLIQKPARAFCSRGLFYFCITIHRTLAQTFMKTTLSSTFLAIIFLATP